LDVQGQLKVIPPVAALVSIAGQNGVIEKDPEPIEIGPQSIEHNDVWCNDKEVGREVGIGFIQLMKEAPGDEEGEYFGFSGSSRHFQHVAGPVLVEHAGGYCARCIEPEQVVFVASPADFKEPDDRLDRFALGEIVAEWGE